VDEQSISGIRCCLKSLSYDREVERCLTSFVEVREGLYRQQFPEITTKGNEAMLVHLGCCAVNREPYGFD
jgi:hypothetical protein